MDPNLNSEWTRRAQPWLGTLVEVGVRGDACSANVGSTIDEAFRAVADVQRSLSRFDPASDMARFNALPHPGAIRVGPLAVEVLRAAWALQCESDGLFDISLGSAPDGWRIDGDLLLKLDRAAQLDLGGIGKGYAVDRAVAALQGMGCSAGWVNAGGDLRVFGDLELPLHLRDEAAGGVRRFARLSDGACATSCYGGAARPRLAMPARHSDGLAIKAHVSVFAPHCLWADALTKIVAASADRRHPLLARHGAEAWLH